MNFLAHLFLSYPNAALTVGNFLGDMIRTDELKELPESVKKGVEFHKAIDHFTDNHAGLLHGKAILRPFCGKYTPVLLDIYHDLLLVERWDYFTEQPFIAFQEDVYKLLLDHFNLIPNRLQSHTEVMVRHQFLEAYTTQAGIQSVLERMAKRVSNRDFFMAAGASIHLHHDVLLHDFDHFFPLLIAFCQPYLEKPNPWLYKHLLPENYPSK